jgi:hypothetical protein
VTTEPAPVPSVGDRLQAAAISMRMLAAKVPDSGAYLSTIAQRFAVDEPALRTAMGSQATDLVYERIHSNNGLVIDPASLLLVR